MHVAHAIVMAGRRLAKYFLRRQRSEQCSCVVLAPCEQGQSHIGQAVAVRQTAHMAKGPHINNHSSASDLPSAGHCCCEDQASLPHVHAVPEVCTSDAVCGRSVHGHQGCRRQFWAHWISRNHSNFSWQRPPRTVAQRRERTEPQHASHHQHGETGTCREPGTCAGISASGPGRHATTSNLAIV